jgi:excisionase family DNA binding protein
MAEEAEHELMTVAEVAALRKVSVETIRRRIRAGVLPVVRDGNRVLIRRTDALVAETSDADPVEAAQGRAQLAQTIRESESSMANPALRSLLSRIEAGQYGPVAGDR